MTWVVVSNILLCSPRKFGEMIQFDGHIFQMAWFNHHLVMFPFLVSKDPSTKVPGNFANPDKATRWWCWVNLGQEFVGKMMRR